MPKFTIEHSSSHSAKDAFEKIKTFMSGDEDVRRFDSKMQCQFNDGAMNGSVKGSQFKADVSVQEQGTGSKIQIVVDLPMLLTPFKGKVQETLQKKLSKYLA
ncbi:polyhydroxyalkanoic acid system family protein [Bdellovibrio sp. HCB337]|uniref:polyhydroxyalkanoic acid system family protein n=1 Tax=Bdellovibrio sp. HCB337 TaxID=3394358 RepID=UPI0039A71323